MKNPPDFVHLFIRQLLTDFEDGLSVSIEVKREGGDGTRIARYSYSKVMGHVIVNRKTRVQTRLDHQSGTRNDILLGVHEKSFLQLRCSQP